MTEAKPSCPEWNKDDHGRCLTCDTHVVDRDGNVWAVVRDGGMVTRATAIGPVSAGIAWLERESGPLLPFNPKAYRASYPRAEL